METVRLEYVNDVHLKVVCDSGIAMELKEYFSFQVPGYQFVPSYKNKTWDGFHRLFNPMKPLLPAGLADYMQKFCDAREYKCIADSAFNPRTDVPDDYILDLAKELKCPMVPRDYQVNYALNALRSNRSLSLSPTSSGKSFIIYLIQQHYWRAFEHRTLIIVPTVSLVHQMAGDFVDYGCNPDDIYKIKGGVDKNTKAPVVISTWQSLMKLDKEWFDQFKVVLGDEAHLFQAKSLTKIMDKLTDAPYRHGFTGTISSESKVHRLVLEGVFGPIKKFVTTKELMDAGTVADFKIKGLVLSHSKKARKDFKAALKPLKNQQKYSAERTYLFNHPKRNTFIANLVGSLKGNNLILFDQIEKHGKILEPMLRRDDRVLHFLHGGVGAEKRTEVKAAVETDDIITYELKFGKHKLSVNELEEIPLSDGSIVKATDLTKDHDVNEKWIKFKLTELDK